MREHLCGQHVQLAADGVGKRPKWQGPDNAEWKQNWVAHARAAQRANARFERARGEAAPSDWRPLCSYTANLERLGEGLLDTDAAWVKLGEAIHAPKTARAKFLGGRPRGQVSASPVNERRLADQYVPQYPWWWSGGILAGLMGLSLWTSSTRVKSLDRLR